MKKLFFLLILLFLPLNVNGALEFDGVNQYVNIGDLDFASTFSVVATVYFDTLSAIATIISKDDYSSNRSFFIEPQADNKIAVGVQSAIGWTQYKTTNAVLSTGAYQHIVVTYDGSAGADAKVKFYIDGVSKPGAHISSYDNGGTPLNNAIDTTIAIGADLSSVPLDGKMFDICIYNRVLSLVEITTKYHAKGIDNITNGLVGRWLMNEGTDGAAATGASSVIDVSGQDNQGTPVNSPVYKAAPLKTKQLRISM